MDSTLFGLGIPEILLIFVLTLIILGPNDMTTAARKLGRWIARVVRSPMWRQIMTTSQELRELPVKIVREAGMEETLEELRKTSAEVKGQVREVTGEVSSELNEAKREVEAETRAAAEQTAGELQQASQELAQPPAGDSSGLPPAENLTTQEPAAFPESEHSIAPPRAEPAEAVETDLQRPVDSDEYSI